MNDGDMNDGEMNDGLKFRHIKQLQTLTFNKNTISTP